MTKCNDFILNAIDKNQIDTIFRNINAGIQYTFYICLFYNTLLIKEYIGNSLIN